MKYQSRFSLKNKNIISLSFAELAKGEVKIKHMAVNPRHAEPRYNPVSANSVDPDQLASEDLDLHCLPFSM